MVWKDRLSWMDIPILPTATLKFGAEGATTTSTAYATIADSDVCINPGMFRLDGQLWMKFVAHLKADTGSSCWIRVYRQNAGSTVDGTELSVGPNGWAKLETDWLDWSNEGANLSGGTWGPESYQLQMKVDGGEGEYNSAIMILSPRKF